MNRPNGKARRGAARSVCMVALMAVGAAAGCSEEVTGPKPTIESAGDGLPVDPGIACKAQRTTDVVVHGTKLSPIPIDIPDDPKVALPTVTLVRSSELDGAAGDGSEVLYSGNPDDPTNLSLLTWQSQEQMTFTINQEVTLADGSDGEIPVGVYDVRVMNPNTNEVEELGAIAITDKPTLEPPSPGIRCLAEEAQTITLTGTTFLEIEGAQVELDVEGVTEPVAIDAFGEGSCTTIAHDGVDARYCTEASLTLAQDLIAVGRDEEAYPAIVVRNPETAACTSEETVNLRLVPPPSIDRVEPPLACVAQEDRALVIEGADFLQIDGADPTVTISGSVFPVDSMGGCGPLETMGHDVQKCSSINITVPTGALGDGPQEVMVQNPEPAACSVSNSVVLTIVPPPSVQVIEPALVCLDDGARIVEIRGSDFLTVEGVVPDVTFSDAAGGLVTIAASAILPGGCSPLTVDRLTVERCDVLTVTLEQDELAEGAPDVIVTNPSPAGCNDAQSGLLTVVPGPDITSAAPPLVCTAGAERTIVLTGTGFLSVDGVLPEVTLDDATVAVTELRDCTAVPANGLTVESCTTAEIQVPQGTLAPGDTVAVLVNPDAVAGGLPVGCMVSNDVVITVPPEITFVSAAPQSACDDTGAQAVTVEGTGFLRVDGTDMTVTVAGTAVTPSAFGGCTPVDVDGLGVETCTSVTFDVDTNALPIGPVSIAVTNPDPSGCGLSDDTVFEIAPPPSITSVVPDNVCADDALSLTITGSGFVANTMVLAGTTTADSVTLNSDTEIVATFTSGLPAGTYDLTVDNGPNCTDVLVSGLVVDPTPIVFFVKPQVLYNGTSIEATIFTTGLKATAATIELVDASGTATPITEFSSPDRPNRIVAQIPSGLAPGDYEVRVTSQIGCVGALPGGVAVTDTLTLALDPSQPIAPAFASPTKPTAVTIFADRTGIGFEPGAIVYLDAVGAGGAGDGGAPGAGDGGAGDGGDGGVAPPSSTAIELRAVTVDPSDSFQLSAVIPAGLEPGRYDLIVVNPSGAVGLTAAALTVTEGEPPVIDVVEPVSISTNSQQVITIFGANFEAANVTVNAICSDPTLGDVTVAATGVTATTTEVLATVDTNGLSAGTVCVIEVVNAADGASFQYSAVSIKNPAANLFPWADGGSAMTVGRRALALVAQRPTNTSRYLYAIGGDDGTLAGALDSVEATPTDIFGSLGTWAPQRNSLPSPRTQAGWASVGRFVYLTGGHDGSAAQDTLLRSQVLDPLAAPDAIDLDASLGDGTVGLDGGLWLYRVSAIFPTSDASNPGGESLAGEVLSVRLPDNPDKIVLSVTVEEIPGWAGYRIYRTPAVGGTVDQVELLAEVTCGDQVCVCGTDISCTFTDDGQTSTTAGSTPLPSGSLGRWHALTGATLNTAREGHASVAVPVPGDPDTVYLYAFGGRDGTGALLGDYEWAEITIDPSDGTQTVSDWTTGDRLIGTAKADLAAWLVTNEDSAVIPSDRAYVFVGTGRTGAANATGEVLSGYVPAGATTGNLLATDGTNLDAETGTTPTRGAAAFQSGAGFLYAFGGESGNGGLMATDTSTDIVAGPDLNNWNSLAGGSLAVERAFAAAARESAFFYVAGGRTAAGVTTSVEQTVQ